MATKQPKDAKDQTVGKVRAKLAELGYEERGGDVYTWEEGLEVSGTYLGMTPARSDDSSPVVRIRNAEGTVERYWAPTILESKLADVEEGTPVYIICQGRTVELKNRKGVRAWGFDVFTK